MTNPWGSHSGRHYLRDRATRKHRAIGTRGYALEPLEARLALSSVSAVDLANGSLANAWALPGVEAAPADAGPMVNYTLTPNGFTPAQLRHAYGFDQIEFGNGTLQGDGSGQTIALVTAYHNPTIQNDLAAFDAYFGLPDPPSFRVVAQDGSTNYPVVDPAGPGTINWELETALDVQWAHAMAPGASIILVEANSPSFADLVQSGVDWARRQTGVSVISMSFGAAEWSNETGLDTYFTTPGGHNGVTFLAASGDTGNPGTYPAFSPNVLAVGGTTLSLDGSNNILSETAWSGSGGGISVYESQPSYQTGVVTQSTTKRTSPDVAFDANPSTGVPVYDSYNSPAAPWVKVGGTSFSSPAWAGLIAVANQGRKLAGLGTLDGRNDTLPKLYSLPSSSFNQSGYSLSIGRGSPKADLVVSGLVGSSSISGQVFNDVNGNGVMDGGETGLSGWTVYEDFDNDGVLDPTTVQNFSSSDGTKTISTSGTPTVSSTISVSGLTANLLDVNVTVDVSHTRDSDLVFTLTSPTGVPITLASHVGLSGDNFTNTKFDDSAGLTILQGTAPFTGSFEPASALAALIGTSANGTWTLTVSDTVSGSGGALNGWSLQLTTGDAQKVTDANGNYKFTNLPSGTYRIREVAQPSYAQTAPGSGLYTVALGSNSNVTGQNFGNQALQSATPTSVALVATSDTGTSSSDGVTNLNNSSPAAALQFQVTGTISGATVNVYADGNLIGAAVAGGTTTTVTTDGVNTLSGGSHTITARQTQLGQPISASSPSIAIYVDTTAPVPAITAVTPSPRPDAVSQMTITFSEAVSGFDLADLQLTFDGGTVPFTGAQTLTSGDGVTWSLNNLSSITSAAGNYQLQLLAAGANIGDTAGNLATTSTSTSFIVTASASSIVGRQLFYNDSPRWDVTNNNLPGFSDDNAIAPDKTAYLPGSGAATFANVSSYTRGINGVMVDLAGAHGTITANDFAFKTGNNNSPSTWATAPAPTVVTVRGGAGAGGSDRVELIWPSSTILNSWLEVIVRGNDALGSSNLNTGLAASDVFFFGSAPADSGSGDTSTFLTNTIDEQAARNDPHSQANPATITNTQDYNRDGLVNAIDQQAARSFFNSNATALKVISIGSGGPFAPQVAATLQGVPNASPATSIALEPGTTGPKSPAQMSHVDLAFALSTPTAHSSSASLGGEHSSHMFDESLLELLAKSRTLSGWRGRSR